MALNVQTVFARQFGRADNYRIPSVIRTKAGTLVAAADERFFTARDNPNRIDKVVRRSTDNGETWGEQIVVCEEVGESKNDGSAAIDPCMLYDESTNTIHMIYSHTPSGIGILNSKKGTGQDKDGNLYLFEGKKRYTLKNGKVYYDGLEDKDYKVTDTGEIFFKGAYAGNYKLNMGKLKELATSYLYITSSSDDGLTWTKPVNLNYQVKEEYMSFIGAGPGVGIVVKEGKYNGRLIFPIY